VNYR